MTTVLPSRPGTAPEGAQRATSNGFYRSPSRGSIPSSMRSTSDHSSASDLPPPLPHPIRTPLDFGRRMELPEPAATSPSKETLAPKKRRKVRPQYPVNSEEKHVEYILVASFDIDRGSVMEHQYPEPIGGDESMLAELMLPDQAHTRSQDWTIFFLHKDQTEQAPKRRRKRRGRRRPEEESEEDEEDDEELYESSDEGSSSSDDDDREDLQSIEGPPLVYVLNLVNTKQDATAKRGAICKAMAICTRHPFLHIYKPLLLLALEEYFKAPAIEKLASLYDAVNSMNLSLLPRLSLMERLILQATDVKDMFIEKFELMIQSHMAKTAKGRAQGESKTSPVQPLRYGLPRDTHEFESVVPYNSIPVPVKVPTAVTIETVGDFSLIKLIQTFSQPHSTQPQPFTTLHPHLTTSGALTHPIMVLLNAILTQKRIIFLGHGLPSSTVAEAVLASCALASGGVLRGFVRHAFPYTDLTKIDDLLKIPGFIAGVTNPTFSLHPEWWDVLCDLTSGRIKISPKTTPTPMTEGVLYFQSQGVAPTSGGLSGEQKGISVIAAAGSSMGIHATSNGSQGDSTGDNAFIATVLHAIADRRGEAAVRAKFRLWIFKFTRLAAAFEEMVYGASALILHTKAPDSSASATSDAGMSHSGFSKGKTGSLTPDPAISGYGYVWPSASEKVRELAANATRIEGWMKTRSYYNFIQDLTVYDAHREIKEIDLQHLYDKLAKLRLGGESSAAIYLAICTAVQTDDQINQLLVTAINTSPSTAGHGWSNGGGAAGVGGLFYLALGLFHPRLDVREAVADLIGRIKEHDAGRHFWSRIGGYEKAAWERVVTARQDREPVSF